jgi:hypothetical protein
MDKGIGSPRRKESLPGTKERNNCGLKKRRTKQMIHKARLTGDERGRFLIHFMLTTDKEEVL